MAKDFKKKLQDLLFPKQPDDSPHELNISPDDVVIGTGTVKVSAGRVGVVLQQAV